jgi:hypothetical protein
MRIAASSAVVTVKHRAMEPVNKIKILPVINGRIIFQILFVLVTILLKAEPENLIQ